MKHENGNCSFQNRAEPIITQNIVMLAEHEIRKNRSEHENGNCSFQNRAEPIITQK